MRRKIRPRRATGSNEIINSQYSNAPDGLSGNEDCGQMSAWYVMASIGLYPLVPGQPHYQLSTPKWDEIQIELANGNTLKFTRTAKVLTSKTTIKESL